MSPETEWARRVRRDQARAAYVAEHGDVCELCGAARGVKGLCGAARNRPLHGDHDHSTGAHRGFICWRANRLLDQWVTPDLLRVAADYLEART